MNDSVDNAIKLLSGWYFLKIKRKTSFFNLDIEFWFDPENEEQSKKDFIEFVLCEIGKDESTHKYRYEIRTRKDFYQIAPNELQITVTRGGLIQYGEKILLDGEICHDNR